MEPFADPAQTTVQPSDEVRSVASALVDLVTAPAVARLPAGSILRDACQAVERRLLQQRLTLALAGDPGAGRRTLLNALLGERILSTGGRRRGSTFTFVRWAPSVNFSARLLEGRVVADLSSKVPDRRALFEKSLAQLERDRTATEQVLGRLRAAKERTVTSNVLADPSRNDSSSREARAPAVRGALRRLLLFLGVVWSWIATRVASWIPRRDLELPPAVKYPSLAPAGRDVDQTEKHALQRQLTEMQSVEQIDTHVHRLREEWEKYERERRAAFLSQVQVFDGTDIGERVVEYPAKHLPEGVTLMDLPNPQTANASAGERVRARVAVEADALVVVADVTQRPLALDAIVGELAEVVPVALVVLTKGDGVVNVGAQSTRTEVSSRVDDMRERALDDVAPALRATVREAPCILVSAESALAGRPNVMADHFVATMGALWERLDGERPGWIAMREAMRLRTGIAELSEALAKERRSSRKRLAALEDKRFPEPAEFRGRLLARVDGAIEKGADDVLAAAIERLRQAMGGLRSEWGQQIASCTRRGELDARLAALDESADRLMADALEQTAELVARELHDVTETLEVWAFEEIRTHYRLFHRLGAEALTPIVSELTRDDLERELRSIQPFEAALETFEKQRVGYGLGGVAGGAIIGTLVAPGIGTAVGAFLGVFAGLLKGTDALRQECIARIDTWLNDAEGHARAQLESKRPELARTIRISLDEALAEAFRRLNDAIARLLAVERRAIEGERAKIAEASTARDELAALDARLARLLAQRGGARAASIRRPSS